MIALRSRVRSVVVELTSACDLRCSYCRQDHRRKASMPGEVLRAACDLAIDSFTPEVDLIFAGGEPLLEFPLIRSADAYVLSRRKPEKVVRYAISTNGLRLTPGAARFLARNRFSVQLSFDGGREAQEIRALGTFAGLAALLDRLKGTLEFVEHPHIYCMFIRDDVDWTCSFPDICEGGFKQSDESHY